MSTGRTTTGRLMFLLTRCQCVLRLSQIQRTLQTSFTRGTQFISLDPKTGQSPKYIGGFATSSSSYLLYIASTLPQLSISFYTIDGQKILEREKRVLFSVKLSRERKRIALILGDGTEIE